MKLSPYIDMSQAPLIYVRLDGPFDEVSLRESLDDASVWFDEHDEHSFALCCSILQTRRPGPAHTKLITSWYKPRRDNFLTRCIGLSIHVPGVIQRTALKTMLRATPLKVPHLITKQEHEALDWCRSQLQNQP